MISCGEGHLVRTSMLRRWLIDTTGTAEGVNAASHTVLEQRPVNGQPAAWQPISHSRQAGRWGAIGWGC